MSLLGWLFGKKEDIVIDHVDNDRKVNFKEDKLKKFNNILEFAKSVFIEYENSLGYVSKEPICAKEHPIIDVIRVLGRTLQTEALSALLFDKSDRSDLSIRSFDVIFHTFGIIENEDLKVEVNIEKEVQLSKDVILPWPWNRDRLINNISRIGEGRVFGKWKQDSNHRGILWLPIGITWVEQGNHSIATGIIQGDGVIKPRNVYDISPVYNHVFCDGEYYRKKADNSIITKVKSVEFAAIFEIGRMMVEKGITF
jgi:hypothetical protein